MSRGGIITNMTKTNKLELLLNEHGGTFSTKEANDAGFSNESLRLLVSSGYIERVAHGVYISPEAFLDKMFVLQKRLSKIIFSHETALFLHDLTDRDPIYYTVTVPTGYEVKRLKEEGIHVFYIKKELHNIGAIEMVTSFGNNVITYNIERTICDCVRSRKQMDISVVTDALKRYVKRSDKDLNSLMNYAQLFRVKSIIKNYLEVLL
jgi:predicted transcriptional regulator of viral defense system